MLGHALITELLSGQHTAHRLSDEKNWTNSVVRRVFSRRHHQIVWSVHNVEMIPKQHGRLKIVGCDYTCTSLLSNALYVCNNALCRVSIARWSTHTQPKVQNHRGFYEQTKETGSN